MNSIRAAWVWRSLVAVVLALWSIVGLAHHDYRPLFTAATLAAVVAAAFLLNSTRRFGNGGEVELQCGTPRAEVKDSPIEAEVFRRDLNDRIDQIADALTRRQQEIGRMERLLAIARTRKSTLDRQLQNDLARYDSSFIESIREVDREAATWTERARSLQQLRQMPEAITTLEQEAGALQGTIDVLKSSLDAERAKLRAGDDHVAAFAEAFKEVLLAAKFPGLYPNDEIHLDPRNWAPAVVHDGVEWRFFDTGSGGKKTAFNVCYALAIHKVAIERGLPVPKILIIDSASKNISREKNPELIRGVYDQIYSLVLGDAHRRTQLLLIDSDYVAPQAKVKGLFWRRMAGQPNAPALIPYYVGPYLLLADPILEEVFTHLHATSMEFKNHYAAREAFINPAVAGQSSRILIRAYFYAKRTKKVRGWSQYIETFVDFDPLNQKLERGREQLRAYLVKHFGFQYISQEEFSQGCNSSQVDELSAKLTERDPEKNPALAQNDAQIVHSIYAMRKKNGEVAKYDGFGLATWWLTKETLVLGFTGDLVRKHGTPYIMRPEFLLNFLSLAPTVALSQRAQALLPTHVGLQLGQHLADHQMEKLLAAVEEWRDLPPERVDVRMSEFADRLKFDRLKRYGANIDAESTESSFKEHLEALQVGLASEAREASN